jgi:alginate O-acetyltransferase complex protein AlgI
MHAISSTFSRIAALITPFTQAIDRFFDAYRLRYGDGLFCSPAFLLFFLVIFIIYWSLPWHRVRVWLLLVASIYFYASWNWRLAFLITATTAMDYFIGRGLDALTTQRWRRLLLLGSLVVNLGVLGYFKYANFFLDSLEELMHAAGASTSLPILRVVLPFGISFYTFEAINYTVDVYRRRVPAERRFSNFMVFILFFPHLVAGPIVRARDFLPQLQRTKRWDWARMQLGVSLFLVGVFKKLAIADRMALFCGPVFEHPEQYNSGAIWMATIAFALRIYCDFSGYTDMALGSAHLLGYKLAQNFNMPYMATNVSDFWHRWHISLSTWLRDYLFIPLGGSRGTSWQTCRNLLLTMTLGGLWHGISWMFVVWGLLHGLFLIVHRFFRAFCQARPRLDALLQTAPGTALRMAVTFGCVCFAWVFFYTGSLEAEATLKQVDQDLAAGTRLHHRPYDSWQATCTVLHRLVVPHPVGMGSPLHNRSLWVTVGVVILCHVLTYYNVWRKATLRLPAPVLGFSYAMLLTVALVLAPDSGKAFIYFQF